MLLPLLSRAATAQVKWLILLRKLISRDHQRKGGMSFKRTGDSFSFLYLMRWHRKKRKLFLLGKRTHQVSN
ncbi:unnamed protein product [Brassica oleracea]